jgi:alkanesulfonate monooxygenase SsuD/methylene tetrahydromethanopterin reductase-like flavin-dependent oxidoreductase (luciferase family)
LWVNDAPGTPGLETLAHFAAGAPRLDLGVGVLPLDQWPPAKIAADTARLGLDPARLWVGLGSGRLRPQLAPLRDAVAELRALLPAARIVVGAMGPNLCRLAGELADGVLLNWMLPTHASRAAGWVDAGASAVGRVPPVTALYIRVAVGDDAPVRLRDEEGRYRRLAEGHFASMTVPVGTVGLAGCTRSDVVEGLQAYRSVVDLPIVRVLAGGDLASLVRVAEAAAP